MHRFLLRLASPYFEGLFNSDGAEAQSGRLVLDDTTEEAVAAMLDFAYSEKLPPSSLKLPTLKDLFVLADR